MSGPQIAIGQFYVPIPGSTPLYLNNRGSYGTWLQEEYVHDKIHGERKITEKNGPMVEILGAWEDNVALKMQYGDDSSFKVFETAMKLELFYHHFEKAEDY